MPHNHIVEGLKTHSSPLSPAVISIWNDIDPEIEMEYESWYQRDHLRDRVCNPGFRSGRRYRLIEGAGRQYFTFSDLDSIRVLTSSYYLDRLANPTALTQKVMPHFRRLIRLPAEVSLDMGEGTGGVAATLVLASHAAPSPGQFVADTLPMLSALARHPWVTRIRIFSADSAANNVPNPEALLRPDVTATPCTAIVVEGTGSAFLHDSLCTVHERFEGSWQLAMPISSYALMYSSRS